MGSVRVHFAVFFSTGGYFSKKAQRLLGVTRERSRVARTPRRCGARCAGAPGGFAKPSTRSPPRIRIEEDARCSLKTARRRKQSVRAQGDLSWACGGKKKTKSTELNEFFFPSFIFLPLAPAKRNAFESRRWAPSASSVVVRCRRGDLSLPAVIVRAHPRSGDIGERKGSSLYFLRYTSKKKNKNKNDETHFFFLRMRRKAT